MLDDGSQSEGGKELQTTENNHHPDDQCDEQTVVGGQGAGGRRQLRLGDQRTRHRHDWHDIAVATDSHGDAHSGIPPIIVAR